MRRLDGGIIGQTLTSGDCLAPGSLGPDWESVIGAWIPGGKLRSVQRRALIEAGILGSRKHVIVSAPTNSGKSLIGHLLLFQAVREGKRAILVEPLRALAQEMAEGLEDLLERLPGGKGKKPPKVRLSTGDYRLEGEFFDAPPPQVGEVIVSTPERLEAILRAPQSREWLGSIGAVVIDEAHLLGDEDRGPTLELLVASLLAMPAPPRICLLSATLGEPESLASWLSPCQLIQEHERTPPLHMEVLTLAEDETADEVVVAELKRILVSPEHAALIFVYRRDSTMALAKALTKELGATVLAYHSGMSAAQKAEVRRIYENGGCRCVVTTTALAMGVNLPATHVIVRDATFPGVGPLSLDHLLQILGRAGRGDRAGTGTVIIKAKDGWEPESLAAQLAKPTLTPIQSTFAKDLGRRRGEHQREEKAATLVAACLARTGDEGASIERLEEILGHTLAGEALRPLVRTSVRWLEDPGRMLAYRGEDQVVHLTRLGERGVRAALPLSLTAGYGQLVRDLLTIDPKDALLGQWSFLDDLIVLGLLATERMPSVRRYSEALVAQVDKWMEERQGGARSVLFREWIAGATAEASKTDELMGSLGISLAGSYTKSKDEARKRGYMAAYGAILLTERAAGQTSASLEARFKASNLAGVEEAWRDMMFWLLAGTSRLCELRCFFYHLKEHCEASPERIQGLKRQFRRIRLEQLQLIGRLKYCSPLGSFLLSLRHALRHAGEPLIGVQSIRRLEEAGLDHPEKLAKASVEQMVAVGVQAKFARQIQAYLRRRAR